MEDSNKIPEAGSNPAPLTKGSVEVRKPSELELLIDVLNGLNQADAVKKYGKAKSTVSGWFDSLEGKNLIRKVGYGTWELTELGHELGDIRDLETQKTYFYDDVEIDFKIVKDDGTHFPSKWNLSKWCTMSIMKVGEVTVRKNDAKSISFLFPKVYGRDENEPLTKAIMMSSEIKQEVLRRYPNLVLSPIPEVKKGGQLGSITLNKKLERISKQMVVRGEDYTVDNTPRPGSFEVKVDIDRPHEAARKLKDTLDFVVSGGLRNDILELRQTNEVLVQELKFLSVTLTQFTIQFRKYLETISK